MEDRPDVQEYLDSLAPGQREEIRAFLARFDEDLNAIIELLLRELQDPGRASEEDLEMRDRLRSGEVPLVSEHGELYYKPRSALTLEDTARFGAFMEAERRRYERQIGEPGQESEN